jgi:hypothetical protein
MMSLSCAELSVAILEERAIEARAHDDSALHLPVEEIPVSIGKPFLDVVVVVEKCCYSVVTVVFKKLGAVVVAKQHGEA